MPWMSIARWLQPSLRYRSVYIELCLLTHMLSRAEGVKEKTAHDESRTSDLQLKYASRIPTGTQLYM